MVVLLSRSGWTRFHALHLILVLVTALVIVQYHMIVLTVKISPLHAVSILQNYSQELLVIHNFLTDTLVRNTGTTSSTCPMKTEAPPGIQYCKSKFTCESEVSSSRVTGSLPSRSYMFCNLCNIETELNKLVVAKLRASFETACVILKLHNENFCSN